MIGLIRQKIDHRKKLLYHILGQRYAEKVQTSKLSRSLDQVLEKIMDDDGKRLRNLNKKPFLVEQTITEASSPIKHLKR